MITTGPIEIVGTCECSDAYYSSKFAVTILTERHVKHSNELC